ncbi:MAG: trimethylamine methyltransferase family protein [Firmicutes bacterium]|nr:trimethylamine methyltransferase family protein [Bacillota bacterium]
MAIEGITSAWQKNQTNYHALTEEKCEQLIEAALRITEEIGFQVLNERGRNLLSSAGCTVEGEIVKIPASLVKESIASAARELVLYDRNGNEAMRAGGTNTYFGNGPTNPCYNDFETGERRQALRSDVTKNTLVSDALPNIDFVMGLAQVSDCNQEIASVVEMREMIANTTKPIIAWGTSVDNFVSQVEMAVAVAGSKEKLLEKPFISIFPGCPIAPLTISEELFDKLEYGVKEGFSIIWPSGPLLGSTAPVTLAGLVSLGLAEVFCGLVMSQLIRKGCAFAGGIVLNGVDMATSQTTYGFPEHCIGEAVAADIFHYLDLPMFQTAGATDSKLVDEQSAIEVSMAVITNAFSCGHIVHDVGFMDAALTASLDQIVMCDEIISYARRVVRGMEINEETLAFDVLKEVGHGGQFFTHEHTFKNFRKELWMPTLMDHSSYQSWINDPTDMRTRVHRKTANILATHKPQPLPEEIIAELDAILKCAEEAVE